MVVVVAHTVSVEVVADVSVQNGAILYAWLNVIVAIVEFKTGAFVVLTCTKPARSEPVSETVEPAPVPTPVYVAIVGAVLLPSM